MKVEFERSLNHNYMIIKNMEEFCEDYQIHMLMEQRIPHVLPVELRFMNGKPELYYDISSKQKLSEWLKIKKITHDILRGIIKSLKNAFEAGIDYLLECNYYILEAEYIFIDVEKYELSLCYYPLYDKDATQSGQEFLQYILEMLDYNDKQAVEEAYEIFRLCMRDGFSIELLRKFIEEKEDTCEQERNTVGTKDEWVQVVPAMVMDEEVEEEGEEFGFVPINLEARRKSVVLFALAEVLISLLTLLLFRKKIAAWIVWGFITLLIVGVILIITCFYERLMQFTRIVSIKKQIPYDDGMYEVSEYEAEVEEEAEEVVNKEVSDCMEAQETMLLGYNMMMAGGCKRLHYIGDGLQEDIVITKNPFTVGKADKDIDYRLQYPFVSRIHFRIDERAGDYFITDTNSKNGIILNKEYLKANETAKLSQGDRIEIGDLVFLFQ